MKSKLIVVALMLGLLFSMGFGELANAQATAVDYTKAKLTWTEDPTVAAPTSYTVKCGTVSGNYTKTKNYIIAPPLSTTGGTAPVSDMVSAPGTYFCTVSSSNLIGESANATEISFQAGRVPSVPTSLVIVP